MNTDEVMQRARTYVAKELATRYPEPHDLEVAGAGIGLMIESVVRELVAELNTQRGVIELLIGTCNHQAGEIARLRAPKDEG